MKFFKVRASFGKLALGKARGPTRDYFVVATPKDGFLTFKDGKDVKKISIPPDLIKKPIFYRCLGIIWFDFHEEKNALVVSLPDYSTVTGYDAVKFDELYSRCLMKPQLQDNLTKTMLFLLVIILIMLIACIVIMFIMRKDISQLKNIIPATVPPPKL